MVTKGLGFFLAVSLAINVFLLATMEFPSSRSTLVKPLEPSPSCPISEGDHHLYQALGLSASQLERVEPLARAFHDRLNTLQNRMEGGRAVLMRLLGQEAIDPLRMDGVRKEMAVLQDEIQREVISHILELKEILTVEQKEKFFALVAQNMANAP
jgi:Spy/CpxP family protein refolding chaperone